MRFSDYDNKFCDEEGLSEYRKCFEEHIRRKQKELDEFLVRGNERIEKIKEWESLKNYKILGRLFKVGRNKKIILIIRYSDGTQKDERYTFSKISEARNKLEELRKYHSGVDWSEFEE